MNVNVKHILLLSGVLVFSGVFIYAIHAERKTSRLQQELLVEKENNKQMQVELGNNKKIIEAFIKQKKKTEETRQKAEKNFTQKNEEIANLPSAKQIKIINNLFSLYE